MTHFAFYKFWVVKFQNLEITEIGLTQDIHKRIVKMSNFEPILSTKSKIDILNVSVHPVDRHKKNSAKII